MTLAETGNLGLAILWIAASGAVGGLVNALLTDNGFFMPKRETTKAGTIIRPGFITTTFVGAVAAVVSFLLYGSASSSTVLGSNEPVHVQLTGAVIGGAILIGIGGARWLTNEVDKSLLKAAAVEAAEKDKKQPGQSRELLPLKPAATLTYARDKL
jgi:hypothetical protein